MRKTEFHIAWPKIGQYCPLMTFEEIPERLRRLQKDRKWLAEACDYTPGSLAGILAPRGNQRSKTQKALRRIWDALDREEERQRSEAQTQIDKIALPDRITIESTPEEHRKWMEAAHRDGMPLNEWMIHAINEAAKRWHSQRMLESVDKPPASDEGNARMA